MPRPAVSPDHAVAVGDVLVAIRLLANGASIRQEPGVSQVHYFHIELDRHDLVLADGLAAESYLDTGNRGMFANANVPLVLHPGPGESAAQWQREAMSCLPLCCRPAQVEPLWPGAGRARRNPRICHAGEYDDGRTGAILVAGGRRFTPTVRDGARSWFVLPACKAAPGCSRGFAVPSELGPGSMIAAASG